MAHLKIALLDNHAIVRHGLVDWLAREDDFEVVGSYANSRELMTGPAAHPVEILILDFVLEANDLDGELLIRSVCVKFPKCRILVFSGRYDAATVILALRVGAMGYLGKSEGLARLIGAVRRVSSDEVYLSPETACTLAEATSVSGEGEKSTAFRFVDLSAREREVMRCYFAGMTLSDIAGKFNRSIKTVSSQKNSAFRKLGVKSNNELLRHKHIIDGA